MTWPLLLELLLKSGVIAAAGLGLSALLAARPARERAAILRVSVCLLLALPLFLWFGPQVELAWLNPPAAADLPETRSWRLDLQPIAGVAVSGEAPARLSWPLIAAFAYAAGLMLVAGRFALGVWVLNRWTETGRPVTHRVWTETLARLDAPAGARLIASPRVRAPLSWGPPPGVILIGEDAVRRPETAQAILAHELAHIRRGDWVFALMSRLALALFWFNPLVWLLHASLSARTEEAADALAVDRMDRHAYARALLDLASDFACPAGPQIAALGMTGSPASLAKRISRIMKARQKTASRPLALFLSAGGLLAVATPLAAVELTSRAHDISWIAPPTPPAPPAPPIRLAPPAPPTVAAPPAPPAPSAPPAPAIMQDGRYIYLGSLSVDEQREIRADADAARRDAEQARRDAEQARQDAADGRREVLEAARVSQADIQRASRDAALAAREAATHARAAAAAAQEEIRTAMIQARADMRRGADDMDRGAKQMRAEALRLRDPAYREQVIADNRSRGNDVTHAELIELSRSMPGQADDMVRSAQRMREQAASRL